MSYIALFCNVKVLEKSLMFRHGEKPVVTSKEDGIVQKDSRNKAHASGGEGVRETECEDFFEQSQKAF